MMTATNQHKHPDREKMLTMLQAGVRSGQIAKVFGLSQNTVKYYRRRYGIATPPQCGTQTPRRTDPPYEFQCAHCHKSVYVDPATGDKRYKFCSRKCEHAFWKHQDRNAGIRCPIYHLGQNGQLREVTKGN